MKQKTFNSIEEMLDEIDPEFAANFRNHTSKWTVRLKVWLLVKWIVFRSKVIRWRA